MKDIEQELKEAKAAEDWEAEVSEREAALHAKSAKRAAKRQKEKQRQKEARRGGAAAGSKEPAAEAEAEATMSNEPTA